MMQDTDAHSRIKSRIFKRKRFYVCDEKVSPAAACLSGRQAAFACFRKELGGYIYAMKIHAAFNEYFRKESCAAADLKHFHTRFETSGVAHPVSAAKRSFLARYGR